MLTIKTNNRPRLLIYGYELSDKEKAEFDWMDDVDSSDFFRYKGQVYALSEAINLGSGPLTVAGWHGAYPQTAFSGVLVKLVDGDADRVIIGRWYE